MTKEKDEKLKEQEGGTAPAAKSVEKKEEEVKEEVPFEEKSLEEMEKEINEIKRREEEDAKKEEEEIVDEEEENKGPVKTPISEEQRKAHGIPEKFKTWEDLSDSYKHNESETSRIVQEKASIKKELEEIKARFDKEKEELKTQLEKKVDNKEMSITEKEEALQRFEDEWETDKAGTLNKLFAERDRQIEERIFNRLKEKETKEKEERTKEQMLEDFKKERDAEIVNLKKEYGEKWDSEILPAIKKIAEEKPYLQTIHDALSIYKARKLDEKEKAEEKVNDARSSFSETGRGAGAVTESLEDSIEEIDSLEDLEKMAGKVKG